MTLAQLRRKGPLFVYAGAVMYAHVIDIAGSWRHLSAAQLKVHRLAGLDPFVDYLPGNANPLTSLCVVNPKFDI